MLKYKSTKVLSAKCTVSKSCIIRLLKLMHRWLFVYILVPLLITPDMLKGAPRRQVSFVSGHKPKKLEMTGFNHEWWILFYKSTFSFHVKS